MVILQNYFYSQKMNFPIFRTINGKIRFRTDVVPFYPFDLKMLLSSIMAIKSEDSIVDIEN